MVRRTNDLYEIVYFNVCLPSYLAYRYRKKNHINRIGKIICITNKMEQSNAAEVNAQEDIMDNADTSSIAIQHTLGSDSGANVDTVTIDADDTSINVVHDDSDVVFVAESSLSDINPTENGQEIIPTDAPPQVMELNENKDIVDDIDELLQSPNATESDTATEKSDCVVLEPMDIDEILDSVNTDQEIATSSEDISDAQCQDEAVEQPQTMDKDELPNAEGEINGTVFK